MSQKLLEVEGLTTGFPQQSGPGRPGAPQCVARNAAG